ncbi:MAG: cytochrome c-type biogenesis CcmF C-terminal domain-containing protein, partial [Pseudomonadota bacterium]
IVVEKRDALKTWTILLAIIAFSFSLLGTFLVRSGVLTSVHAFALDPERGVAILAILGLLTGGGLALFAWRAPSLTPGGAFAPISREGAIVVNNLFLSISCAAILIGTLYPLALEAATGETISVGPPYFNLTFGLLMAPLLVAAPFGPFLGLGQADSAAAARRLLVAAGAALVAAAATAFAVFGDGAGLAAIGVGVGVWLIAGAAADFGARVGLTLRGLGEAPGLIARARPGQWASALGHAGLGVLMLGVVGSSLWRSELVEVIEVGGSHEIAGFTVTLDSVASERGANYLAQRARFSVTRGDTDLGTLSPERRFYPAARSSTAEVAIRRGLVGDFYVVLGDQRPNGARVVQAYYFPLISFIYLGAGMIAAGGATAFAARRRASAAPLGDAAVAARQPAE